MHNTEERYCFCLAVSSVHYYYTEEIYCFCLAVSSVHYTEERYCFCLAVSSVHYTEERYCFCLAVSSVHYTEERYCFCLAVSSVHYTEERYCFCLAVSSVHYAEDELMLGSNYTYHGVSAFEDKNRCLTHFFCMFLTHPNKRTTTAQTTHAKAFHVPQCERLLPAKMLLSSQPLSHHPNWNSVSGKINTQAS